MAQGRKPKGDPGGGQFTGGQTPEADITLDEDIERVLRDAMPEARKRRQTPPPKTEDSKEGRLNISVDEIRQQLDLAAQFVAEGRAKMQSSAERRLAVERLFEILGEQVKRLPARYRNDHGGVDWKGLVGLRDRLSHGYGLDINEAILWRALTVDLSALRIALDISVPDASSLLAERSCPRSPRASPLS